MNRPNTSPTTLSIVRCAIYTRKSTEEGLEQEFNSLDAQRESGQAYIQSQQQEGWACLPDRYDDGGFTGANTERPALQRLLTDIGDGKVDCVVIYKIDRLSRSLLDFAKMMDLFDQQRVALVSVTQQFTADFRVALCHDSLWSLIARMTGILCISLCGLSSLFSSVSFVPSLFPEDVSRLFPLPRRSLAPPNTAFAPRLGSLPLSAGLLRPIPIQDTQPNNAMTFLKVEPWTKTSAKPSSASPATPCSVAMKPSVPSSWNTVRSRRSPRSSVTP